MNETRPSAQGEPADAAAREPRHPYVRILAGVLLVESAALAVATAFLIIELLVSRPDSYASAIALAVLAAMATAWVAVIAVNLLRGRAWVRGAALVVQVLLGAVAIGSFQGLLPRPDIGALLLIPVIVVVVLLFTKPVLAATARE